MTDYNEEEIIRQLQDPNQCRNAFSKIIGIYQERIYWQIRKMVVSHDDADDIMQNTFLKAWKNIDTFRGESKISTWLYRIAVNESITFLARQRQEKALTTDEDLYLIDNLEADEYFDGNEIEKLLQEAILHLPEKQRLVFNMRYFDEIKYEDMSEILNTSVGALKASYHIAAKKIEEYLVSNG
ncbi:MAG: RNA polymerase sigma factor [Bacteroidales bacterium]|nr:RNA polymerase sigma factor [Bacteroidales bacterium]